MSTLSNQMKAAMDDLIDQASEMESSYDMQALQVFAQQLRGIGDCRTDDEAMEALPKLRVPDGFRHARYTFFQVVGIGPNAEIILGQPRYAGEIISSRPEGIELRTLVRSALVLSAGTESTSMGPGRWLESFALPIRDPGMLELALVLEPREINDGSVLARIQAAIKLAQMAIEA